MRKVLLRINIRKDCVHVCERELCDVDPCRWQTSKTTKEDADEDIAKYDG